LSSCLVVFLLVLFFVENFRDTLYLAR